MKGWSPFTKSSPAKTEGHGGAEGHTHKGDRLTVSSWREADKEYKELKKGKGGSRKAALLAERYGGTWTKRESPHSTNPVWQNETGQTPHQAEQSYLKPKGENE